jgi:pilus assembly protein Flp/PilA
MLVISWYYSVFFNFTLEYLIMKFIANLLRDESGATAIEYGLIAALIAVVAIGTITSTGQGVSNTFQEVTDELP